MAYTTPKTWNVSDVLPASELNTYVRDNVAWVATAAPRARVYKTTAFSHNSSGNWLSVPMDAERYDPQGCHNTSSQTERLVVPSGAGGIYAIGAHVDWDNNTTGGRIASIELNGTGGSGTFLARGSVGARASADSISISTEHVLAAGDYVVLSLWQDSGGTRTVDAVPNTSPELWFRWVGTTP